MYGGGGGGGGGGDGSGGGSFLACEDFGNMFDHSFPACALFFFFLSSSSSSSSSSFFKVKISLRTLTSLFVPGSVHSSSQ